jgi:hypothetical protein
MRYPRLCGYEVVALLAATVLLLFPSVLLSQITSPAVITHSAGTGFPLFNGDQGFATALGLSAPTFVTFDAAGNQYLSDTGNNCIRRIDAAGSMTTIVGLATSLGSDTCDTTANPIPGASQGLLHPAGLAIDRAGRLFIADSLHHCVRTLASGKTGTASLTTVAGTCGSSGTSSITPNPQGVALDASGNLYIAVQLPSRDPAPAPIYQVLRHTAASGPADACVVAGVLSANLTLCPNITGGGVLDHPTGLAFDTATNSLYIADTGNQCVRRLSGLTTLETAAGQCANDGTGSSLATLRNPYGVAITQTGLLLVTQTNPDNLVSVGAGSNSLTLIAGLPNGAAGAYALSQDGSPSTSVPLYSPRGVAVDQSGVIIIADSGNNIVRRITASRTAPKPLTITVASASRFYGSPNPEFTGTIAGALPSERIGETLFVVYTTVATSRSSSGRYSITAAVSGSSAASYAVTVQPGTLEITPAATSTTLTSSAAANGAATSATFTANVSSTAGIPAGTVAFYEGGSLLLGTANLDSTGKASFTSSALNPGTHAIAAIYRDTTNYTTSAATLTQVISAPTGSFTLAASQTVPAARSAGQSVYQLTLNSVGVFSGTIALSCSGLPAGGTCAFGSSPTLAPGGSANVVMTITTPTKRASLATPTRIAPQANLAPLTAAAVFPLELPVLSALLAGVRRRRYRFGQLLTFVAFAALLATLTGCGAGGSIPLTTASTQPTAFTVQVTGTSLTFAAPPQTITLTVAAP